MLNSHLYQISALWYRNLRKRIMKMKSFLLALHVFLFSVATSFAQIKLTPKQKTADSIAFANFKKQYPQEFNDYRLPAKLLDGSYTVEGYTSTVQLINNHIKDSVYHNFHPGMPDTTTVNPYNDIKVIDATVKVIFFHGDSSGPGSFDEYISPIDRSLIKNNKIDGSPINLDENNSLSIRLSINGKLISDWQPLNQFKDQLYKAGSKWVLPGKKDTGSSYMYFYGWAICDTMININDQLLIEVKTNKENWMVDRYNITRVAASPVISAIAAPGNNIMLSTEKSLEKKTLF
jgi:hypothetical protein